jgi:cytochrome oxidase Cu insertion factor (SCO1/SenC/PrrC family)
MSGTDESRAIGAWLRRCSGQRRRSGWRASGLALLVALAPPSTGAVGIGGPFELVDQHGATRTDKEFRGSYMLMYFGFTHCPDTCPTALLKITNALEGLAELDAAKAEGVVPAFVSVDPERDTPEAAQAWLERMGVAGGPVHILLGSRRELTPVWQRFGIVPLDERERETPKEDEGDDQKTEAEKERERSEALAQRPAPEAAHEQYPAVGDGSFRGRARHVAGLEFEHSAYALLIDKHGRQRVGFPYEQITSELLLTDLQMLKAEQ